MNKNMTLQSVMLENFKRHATLEVQFSPAVTAIRGPNYAGKSSVLQAVFYAMFGATAVPGGRQAVVRTGAKTCKVEFSFDLDGKACKVSRTLTTANVLVEGELVATGNSPVSAWFEDLFGMDQKTVMLLAYSSQGETSALVTLGASALNKIIETVANTDYVDKLVEKAGLRIRSLELSLAAVPIALDQNNLLATIEGLEAAVTQKQAELVDITELVTIAGVQFETVDLEFKAAVEHNHKVQAANRLYAQAETQHKSAVESLSKLQETHADLAADKNDYKALIDSLDTHIKQLQLANSEALVNNAKHESTKEQLVKVCNWIEGKGKDMVEADKEWQPVFDTLAPEYEKLKLEASALVTEYDAANIAVKKAEKNLKSSVCVTCGRPMEDSHLELVQKELDKAKEDFEAVTVKYQNKDKELKNATKEYNRVKALLPQAGWKEWWNKALAEREVLVTAIYGMQHVEVDSTRLIDLQHKAQQFRLVQDRISTFKASEISWKLQIMDLAAKCAELWSKQELEIDIVEVSERRGALQHKYTDAKLKKYDVQGTLGGMRHDLDTAKRKLEDELTNEAKRTSLERSLARFKAFQKWLRDNKAAFMESIWAGLLGVCSEFVAQVTSNRVTSIERDNEGSFWFTENGDRLPIVCASGGQRSIIGAGLRIALATLLPQGCRFVVLDEPSAELNDEHAAALAGALRGQDRQVVLVTHREGDEFAADHVVVLE